VARSGTEEIFHSKKFIAPLVFFLPYTLPAIAGTYLVSGHFSPEHELATHPAFVDASIPSAGFPEVQPANFGADTSDRRAVFAMARKESAEVVGTKQEWNQYREQFDGIENEAVKEGIIPDRGYPQRLVKQLGEREIPVADRNGELSLEVDKNGRTRQVDVSANDILGRDSDSQLAYALVLARVEHELNSPKHRRETIVEFQDDWQLMQRARENMSSKFATMDPPAKNHRATLLGAN